MAEATGDPYTNYLVNDETAAIDENNDRFIWRNRCGITF